MFSTLEELKLRLASDFKPFVIQINSSKWADARVILDKSGRLYRADVKANGSIFDTGLDTDLYTVTDVTPYN